MCINSDDCGNTTLSEEEPVASASVPCLTIPQIHGTVKGPFTVKDAQPMHEVIEVL